MEEKNWTPDVERMRWRLLEYETERRFNEPPGYGDGDDGDGGASVREPRRPKSSPPAMSMAIEIGAL